MQLGKRAKFKQGLKIECLTLLLQRRHAVMYRSDITRVAKIVHVYILLPHLNLPCTVQKAYVRCMPSFPLRGESTLPRSVLFI